MKKFMLLIGAGLALIQGCAHVYHVNVDAINDGQPAAPKTYVILPGNPDTGTGDLQFKEYARYLSRALARIGYTAAAEQQPPEVEIYLSYGLGSPTTRVRTYTVPVWGQTGTEVVTQEQTVNSRSGSTTVTTTNVTPEYGVTGFASQEENITVYPKYVEIDAYAVKNAKPGERLEELWKTTLRSEGRRNELRHVFPILIAAAAPYLGGNTGREIVIPLTENQDAVKIIKGKQE